MPNVLVISDQEKVMGSVIGAIGAHKYLYRVCAPEDAGRHIEKPWDAIILILDSNSGSIRILNQIREEGQSNSDTPVWFFQARPMSFDATSTFCSAEEIPRSLGSFFSSNRQKAATTTKGKS